MVYIHTIKIKIIIIIIIIIMSIIIIKSAIITVGAIIILMATICFKFFHFQSISSENSLFGLCSPSISDLILY